ncbi:uncharacterized protein HLK63_E01001 [Nakaseomyces glabratus]|nr:uncharacterized protein GW608_E01001 [Nakaseomyces glabratus]UCS24953.1 uncharacterized protein HLK63_E01001 [Nakaseomyces glabratus]UCS30183.1 uncharacterized protein HLK64_E01001 [Nakaseomyces glabratus]UCS35412.1 uncharacterized protein HLK62_E01001 [Nakaseomyces glabratus]
MCMAQAGGTVCGTMDYKEEQEQELEVLRSIYPDELEVVKEYPGVKFELQLKLELQELIDTSHLSKDHTLHCTFQLPEEYPDVNPVISIDVEETLLNSDDEGEGEDEDEDEQQYDEHGNRLMSKYENIPDTISIADYVSGPLVAELEEQIETDMLTGMQMCFALISSIKEKAEHYFLEQLTLKQKQHDQELQEREKEEQAKFHGTKVTRESFLGWRTKFRQEHGLDKRDEERRLQAHHGRLTGKQMFEQGIEGTLDDIDDTDVQEVATKLQDDL